MPGGSCLLLRRAIEASLATKGKLTEEQDRLSSVSWLLHLPSTCFRIGSKLRCILPSQMSMASARTKCFECLASTGVYAPGTMFPIDREADSASLTVAQRTI